jgi:23S rRNA (cytosine1962-C5)-methyltransferase
MPVYPSVILKPKREQSLLRRHPWVFSGAVDRIDGQAADGDVVFVRSHRGDLLATGHYQRGSILVRVFAFEEVQPDANFWQQKLRQAFELRQRTGLPSPATNCFRLVHGEGDGLPGLIIDIYGHTAVLQCHSIGMHRQRQLLVEALIALPDLNLQTVYDKSAEALPSEYAAAQQNTALWGQSLPGNVLENDAQFFVDWEQGQKTGFFLDQRDNRALLGRYAPNRSVLNTFCYSGGFSVYALRAGASQVVSVDSSKKAMEWTDQNVALNGFQSDQHESVVADVLKYFARETRKFDIVVVDPPAFAKSREKRHQAVQAYKRLNIAALKCLQPGGLLFTFSCSQVVDKTLFYNTIVAAGIESGRPLKVLHHLDQPADHPIGLFHPEGDYLKGLVISG